LTSLILGSPISAAWTSGCTTIDQVKFLKFADLEKLSKFEDDSNLNAKVDSLLNTAICGSAVAAPIKTFKYNSDLQANYFRVTHWNLQQGIKIPEIEACFTNPEEYCRTYLRQDFKDIDQLKKEVANFKDTDILMLNEVDIGIERSGFDNTIYELAKTLKANYVFAPEFLELNNEYLPKQDKEKQLYRALHGNAIISKYPIKKVEVLSLPLCYDWYSQEKERITVVEKGRRKASKAVINETIYTEIRKGNRIAIIADILLPNKQTITVVSTHLENRSLAKCRTQQMKAILDKIQDHTNPVILGGDLNNFERSAEPTSATKIVTRTVTDPTLLARATITYFNPYALMINPPLIAIEKIREFRNPLAADVPIIFPNRARALFDVIEGLRFADGTTFDFSGNKELTINHKEGTLNNSNQRVSKGFQSTYRFKRAWKIGLFKIDWLFVKPIVSKECLDEDDDLEDLDRSCKNYYPGFGQTLKVFNYSLNGSSLSDHSPITCQILFTNDFDTASILKQ